MNGNESLVIQRNFFVSLSGRTFQLRFRSQDCVGWDSKEGDDLQYVFVWISHYKAIFRLEFPFALGLNDLIKCSQWEIESFPVKKLLKFLRLVREVPQRRRALVQRSTRVKNLKCLQVNIFLSRSEGSPFHLQCFIHKIFKHFYNFSAFPSSHLHLKCKEENFMFRNIYNQTTERERESEFVAKWLFLRCQDVKGTVFTSFNAHIGCLGNSRLEYVSFMLFTFFMSAMTLCVFLSLFHSSLLSFPDLSLVTSLDYRFHLFNVLVNLSDGWAVNRPLTVLKVFSKLSHNLNF